MHPVESDRLLLEDIQTLESAITSRFQRNPVLYPSYDPQQGTTTTAGKIFKNKKRRGYKETLLQKLEIQKLMNQYFKQRDALQKSLDEPKRGDKISIFTLEQFDQAYQEIVSMDISDHTKSLKSLYAMKSTPRSLLSEFASDINILTLFSGEEAIGKYLDLTKCHSLWLQLSEDKSSYVKYLEIVDHFEDYQLAKGRDQRNKDYLEYLKELETYLVSFIKRAKPLFDIDGFLKSLNSEKDHATDETGVDSLYCRYCRKTFAKETVYQGHLTGKKHLKSVENYKEEKDFKSYESTIRELFTLVEEERKMTRLNTERKKFLTEREKEIEIEALEKDEPFSDVDSDIEQDNNDNDEDEEEEYNNNPQNLPLGPDGNPIPFWLYKLQGLSVTYTCELCGDQTYKGRKAFESHFNNAKHTHGLKCLGITPSKVFRDITKIDEAMKLWENIKSEEKSERLVKDSAVEVEDDQGNVMSEKMYEDLKRQGLL